MGGAGIDHDFIGDARLVQSRFELADGLDRYGRVGLAEEREDRHLERRELRDIGDGLAVVEDGGVELLGERERGAERPAAPEAPADRADRRRLLLGREVDIRLAEVVGQFRLAAHRALHDGHRAVGRGRHAPAVEVDREGGVALVGQLTGHVADVVVEAPPLVDDDDARQRAAGASGLRERARHRLAVEGGVGDLLGRHVEGVGAGGGARGLGRLAVVLLAHLAGVVGVVGATGREGEGEEESKERAHRTEMK